MNRIDDRSAPLAYRLFARPLARCAHPLRVIDRKRHGLFLIHVLSRIHCRDEALRMEMLWSGDQDRVDRLIVQHMAVVDVSLRVRRQFLRAFEPPRVDIGEGDEFGIRAGDGLPRDLRAAISDPDDAEADAVIRGASTRPVARLPARPVATLPMKFLRVCMDCHQFNASGTQRRA